MEGKINQNTDKYSTADNKTKGLIIEKICKKLYGLQKGSEWFECSAEKFNGRYIECIRGKLFLLRDKRHVYSCLRTTFTRQKITNKKNYLLVKETTQTGTEQYYSAYLEQKRLIWLCHQGLL